MSEIVVVGSCMVDFICYATRLPRPGETLLGSKFTTSNGGKGANQCVAATRLGASTALVASLGADSFGKEYFDRLKLENVDVSKVSLREGVTSGIAQIAVAESGENNIIIVPGANELLSPKDVDEAEKVIKNAKVLLCQFETPLSTTLHVLKLYKGHGLAILNGAPAVSNPDPELLRACDIFCVNEVEAEVITGVPVLSVADARTAADKLLSKGCNAVLVTLGALGAVYASRAENDALYVPTEKVTPVDTTGAGDAFLGAFAYFAAYHKNLTMKETIRRACYVAARSVLKSGTQTSFPYRDDLPDSLFVE